MKAIMTELWKMALAALLAVCIASCFSLLYYNPIIHITNPNGDTDYRWLSNDFTSTATEGFAQNRTDENGFNNAFSPTKNEIDVLLMGSSHTEAFQVAPDENMGYLLNESLSKEGKYLYNIGVSGHSFLRCISNLETALSRYQPSEAVIIETDTLLFSPSDIQLAITGQFPKLPSYDSGVLFELQKIPYAKLFAKQLQTVMNNRAAPAPVATPAPDTVAVAAGTELPLDVESAKAYAALGDYLAQVSEQYGVEIIILSHAPFQIAADGTAIPAAKTPAYDMFASFDGATFLDASETFVAHYTKTFALPYGFANSAVNMGHLNKTGHALMAQTVLEHWNKHAQ